MRDVSCDVAVIGGGPAGSACAIALRQTFPALSVLMIEATDYTRPRAGEVLPPLARGVLSHLGVLEQVNGSQARPSCGLASAWGSHTLEERDYFYGTTGEGWHLDRSRFDALLAQKAETLGAVVLLQSSLQEAQQVEHGWRLRLNRSRTLTARWIVDATGRKARFARSQDVTQDVQDRLTAFLRVVNCQSVMGAQTVIEAASHGWWYTAPLPGGRRVVGLLTDADIGSSLQLAADVHWRSALDTTQHMRRFIGEGAHLGDRMVCSAATLSLHTAYGEGWIAAGDAAAAYDPLSGCGIVQALRSGIVAAFATGDMLCHGQSAGLVRYATMLRAQVSNFKQVKTAQYAREARWNEHPFWQRRQRTVHQNMPLPSEVEVHG
jgi:flavin-dependent dehydrogenase